MAETTRITRDVGLEVAWQIAQAPRGWNLLTLCGSQREQLGSIAGAFLDIAKENEVV